MIENVDIENFRAACSLRTEDFYYDLPKELIAQHPTAQRDACRLMTLDKHSGAVAHHVFSEIIDMLRPEDILVVNSSKVIPARLLGVSQKTGSPMELLLLRAQICLIRRR